MLAESKITGNTMRRIDHLRVMVEFEGPQTLGSSDIKRWSKLRSSLELHESSSQNFAFRGQLERFDACCDEKFGSLGSWTAKL